MEVKKQGRCCTVETKCTEARRIHQLIVGQKMSCLISVCESVWALRNATLCLCCSASFSLHLPLPLSHSRSLSLSLSLSLVCALGGREGWREGWREGRREGGGNKMDRRRGTHRELDLVCSGTRFWSIRPSSVQGFHEVPNCKRFLSLTQPLAGAISISNTPMASIQENCEAPFACR